MVFRCQMFVFFSLFVYMFLSIYYDFKKYDFSLTTHKKYVSRIINNILKNIEKTLVNSVDLTI